MIWFFLLVFSTISMLIFAYRIDRRSQQDGKKKPTIVVLVLAVLLVVAGFFVMSFRPIYVLNLRNGSSADITVATDFIDDLLFDQTGLKWRQAAAVGIGETASLMRFRLCGTSSCRLSPYPVSLIVSGREFSRLYEFRLPGAGDSFNACGNLFVCNVTLKYDEDGLLYALMPGTGSSLPDINSQPTGFPISPSSNSITPTK